MSYRFIQFAGCPRSGKSYHINQVRHQLDKAVSDEPFLRCVSEEGRCPLVFLGYGICSDESKIVRKTGLDQISESMSILSPLMTGIATDGFFGLEDGGTLVFDNNKDLLNNPSVLKHETFMLVHIASKEQFEERCVKDGKTADEYMEMQDTYLKRYRENKDQYTFYHEFTPDQDIQQKLELSYNLIFYGVTK